MANFQRFCKKSMCELLIQTLATLHPCTRAGSRILCSALESREAEKMLVLATAVAQSYRRTIGREKLSKLGLFRLEQVVLVPTNPEFTTGPALPMTGSNKRFARIPPSNQHPAIKFRTNRTLNLLLNQLQEQLELLLQDPLLGPFNK